MKLERLIPEPHPPTPTTLCHTPSAQIINPFFSQGANTWHMGNSNRSAEFEKAHDDRVLFKNPV